MIESNITVGGQPMLAGEKEAGDNVLRTANTASSTPSSSDSSGNWRSWFKRDIIAFFLLGMTMALPTTILFTAAHSIFPRFTGAISIAFPLFLVATYPLMHLVLHRTPYNVRIIFIFVCNCLAFYFCTLGYHIPPGPISGTSMAATIYAFAPSALLESAAFFDPKVIPAFHAGSGSSIFVGPVIFIGIMQGLNNDWRKSLHVCICTAPILPLVWWILVSRAGRTAAEKLRRTTKHSHKKSSSARDPEAAAMRTSGFGPERTRIGFFFKTLLPRYVVPLAISKCLAAIALFGVTTTLMVLRAYKEVPKGELQYMISYLAYGVAQFLFSALSSKYPLPNVWLWAGLQTTLVAITIVQIFEPFLKYYGVWVLFMFLCGGISGASTANTSNKISEDFRKKGESEDVRSFALSYGQLGDVAGDVLGGGLAILTQMLAVENLAKGPPGPPGASGAPGAP